MKKIRLYFRWLLGYWFGLCSFDCRKSHVCDYYESFLCTHCDQCIMDMCGHCRKRKSCSFAHRQMFARSENWR